MPKYVDHNYMGHEFDEKYVYQFPDANAELNVHDDFGAFAVVIEMACNDYDEFNFAVMSHKQGGSQESIRKFIPGLAKYSLEGVSPLSDDFDKFDIQAFYNFCN